MINQYKALVTNSPSDLTTFSNTSAFLMQQLDNLNWAGFYFLKDNQLILGPFQGKVACEVIDINKGVCGACVRSKEPIIVDDVHQFEGHIACDEMSQSEMVIPLIFNDELIGVLDLDAPIKNRFARTDLNLIQSLVDILTQSLKKGSLLLP